MEMESEVDAGEATNGPDDVSGSSGGGGDPVAAAPPSAPVQPQQPQGPDWNGLGQQYGGYEGVQQSLQYVGDLRQRYSDPAWAQKFDALFKEQQQQQAHPYDWTLADEQRAQALREQGEQHPDYPRLQAEFTNFFSNPIGQLANYVNHPKVVEPIYQAMLPQLQDYVNRAMQPLQQFVQQQGENQFRQQYEPLYMKLPDNVKQAHQQGRFGQGPQSIINAIEFAKTLQQQSAAVVPGEEEPKPKPSTDNRNTARDVKPTAKKDENEELLDKAAKAWSNESKKKK